MGLGTERLAALAFQGHSLLVSDLFQLHHTPLMARRGLRRGLIGFHQPRFEGGEGGGLVLDDGLQALGLGTGVGRSRLPGAS